MGRKAGKEVSANHCHSLHTWVPCAAENILTPTVWGSPLAMVWKHWKLSFACTKITNGGEETETETGVQRAGERTRSKVTG